MRLYEIIHIGEIDTDKGYAITNKKIKPKDKRVFVNGFFGYAILKEKDKVNYVSSIEKIIEKGEFFVVDKGECFKEGDTIFIKQNKKIERLMHKAKDMTKCY